MPSRPTVVTKKARGAVALCGTFLLLGGCASPTVPAKGNAQASPAVEVTSCDDALLYETADAHPEIRWLSIRPGVSRDMALSCLLSADTDDGTIEMAAYMSSGLYDFVRECQDGENRILRVFEYKNKSRPYLLRLHTDPYVDPKTYVVVSSVRVPSGTYRHAISESSNNAERVKACQP